MARIVVVTLALAALAGCGGGEARREARAPSKAQDREKTGTSQAALTTTSTTTTTSAMVGGPKVDSTSVNANASTNAAMVQAATPPVSTSSSVMRITTARCDREAACNHVGTGKSFADKDECVNAVGHDVVTMLGAGGDECPLGIDADRLSTCLSDLQAQSCEGDSSPAVETVSSCDRARLCTRSF